MLKLEQMDRKQFQTFERAFDDSFLTLIYHQWAYSNDMWGDFLLMSIMGGEL